MTRAGKQGVAYQLAQKGLHRRVLPQLFAMTALTCLQNCHGIHLAESHVLCIPCGLTSQEVIWLPRQSSKKNIQLSTSQAEECA